MKQLVPGVVAAIPFLLVGLACGSEESLPAGPTGGAGAATTTGAGGASSSTSSGGAAVGGAGADGGGTTGGGGQGGGAVTTGCGKASPTGVQSLSIEVDGVSRSYVLSIPAGYDPATPLSLVFAWHGRGGSGSLARLYFGIEEQAAGAAIFVYPDGLPIDGGDTGWDLTVAGPDVALFDALREQVEADYCVDDARVFSTGHSFGGYMTNTLGCARASELRAIAPAAGGGPWANCDATPLSAFVVHGTNDTVVDPSQGQASLEYWRSNAGCTDSSQPVEPSGCVEYQGCSASRVVFCSHDEGHNWPALAPAGVWGFFASS